MALKVMRFWNAVQKRLDLKKNQSQKISAAQIRVDQTLIASATNAGALLNIKEIHMNRLDVDRNVQPMLNAFGIEPACTISVSIHVLEHVEIRLYAKL